MFFKININTYVIMIFLYASINKYVKELYCQYYIVSEAISVKYTSPIYNKL